MPPAMAMAAIGTFDFDAWKPWLSEVCKLCDLHIPEMPLLKHHITDHLQPPKRRPKYNNMLWNCCVARPVFENEIRRGPARKRRCGKDGIGTEPSKHGEKTKSRNGTSLKPAPSDKVSRYTCACLPNLRWEGFGNREGGMAPRMEGTCRISRQRRCW
jgi:hypothetical protein